MLKKTRNILLEKKMKKAIATTRKGKRTYIIEIPTLFLLFTKSFFGTIDVFAAKPQIKKNPESTDYDLQLKSIVMCMQCSYMVFNVSFCSTQDATDLVCMVETVIFFVPPTLNTTHVTFRMDLALGVTLHGLGYIATQVHHDLFLTKL